MSAPYEGNSGTTPVPGVKGTNNAGGDGVFGFANANGRGVVGVSEAHTGVEGNSTGGSGVWGESRNAEGVHGISHGGMGVCQELLICAITPPSSSNVANAASSASAA